MGHARLGGDPVPGEGCAGAERHDDGEHLVAQHKLLNGTRGLGRLVSAVLDHQLDLAPVDAALRVGLVDPHLHAVGDEGHARGHRAGQIQMGPEQDPIVRYALGFGQGGVRVEPYCGCRGPYGRHSEFSLHVSLALQVGFVVALPHLTGRQYMASIMCAYFRPIRVRFSFIVGVSSSSSAVNSISISR